MARFALISPPFYSHLRLFEAVAAELIARGHEITFVLNAGAGDLVSLKGALVRTVGETTRSGESLAAVMARAARPSGPFGILRTVRDTSRLTDELCRGAPAILREIGAEAILGDQMEPAAGLLADHLGLPLVSLASALPINREPAIPLPFLGWNYDPSGKGVKRNEGGEKVARLLLARQRRTIAAWAREFGLGPRESAEDCLSDRAQITQIVPAFDFPRETSAERLHYVGPIRSGAGEDRPLDLDIDPSRPFVFASFGTLQGHRLRLFRQIAKACRAIGAQLLVCHCGALTDRQAASIGATWVRDFVPQRAALAKADVCVTHAGLNTVLDALACGVPILAFPVAFDQPGIAARIVHHGVGKRLSRFGATPGRISQTLASLFQEASFRSRAAVIGRQIRTSGGVGLAADIIERAACAPVPARRTG